MDWGKRCSRGQSSAARSWDESGGEHDRGRTIVSASNSTNNEERKRDPEMQQTAKDKKNWFVEMKLHIGVEAHTGRAHSAVVTSVHVHDKNPLSELLHVNELRVYGDCAYVGQQEVIAERGQGLRQSTRAQDGRRSRSVAASQKSGEVKGARPSGALAHGDCKGGLRYFAEFL